MPVDLDNHPQILLVRQHLATHLGPPDQVMEVSGAASPDAVLQAINLAYFAPNGPKSPVVFATCGVSLYQMPDGRRVEGLVLLNQEPSMEGMQAVSQVLCHFAAFSESQGVPVQVGDVLRAPEELSKFSDMDALLLMPPVTFVDSFHGFEVAQNQAAEMIWLMPVYESEANYALAHGPRALLLLLASQELKLTDPNRDEANTLQAPQEAEEQAQTVVSRQHQELADNPPVPRSGGRPKTARRDTGQGSYGVEESPGSVRINRGEGPAARGSGAASGPAGAPGRSGPASMPSRRSARPPQARLRQTIPQKKEPIRFDLDNDGASGPPPPVVKKAPPRKKSVTKPQTAQSKAEAKKKRIAELKAKAKEAVERAKMRHSGETPELVAPVDDSSENQNLLLQQASKATAAAPQRRGAPKRGGGRRPRGA